MIGPHLANACAVIPDDDAHEAPEGVALEFDGSAFRVGIESIPNEFRNCLYMVVRTRHLLQVVMFGFESEYDHF